MSRRDGVVDQTVQGVAMPERNERIHNRERLRVLRRALRNNATNAEAILWRYLKRRQLKGRKFRRQHSIGPYIVDFYCPAEKLAVELDGDTQRSGTARIR